MDKDKQVMLEEFMKENALKLTKKGRPDMRTKINRRVFEGIL